MILTSLEVFEEAIRPILRSFGSCTWRVSFRGGYARAQRCLAVSDREWVHRGCERIS